MGLGYEISSVSRPGLLSARNSTYVDLVRRLGPRGIIRIGGNTADYATYSANGAPVSSPENKSPSVVNDSVLDDLGAFLRATGWQLIWGLNLGRGTLENAVAEAKAVTRSASDDLVAFEIGNEPDLFPHAHRQKGYSYEDYLREFRTWRDALRKEIPGIAFAGPDAATATGWVPRFAADEGKNIKLLTHHYYRDGARNPTATIDELLHPDPKLAPILAQLSAASKSSGLPYRICETNSFFGGGKPGVSDTLAAALWVLDFMFTLASGGCAGVNMETGVNQLGFISSYSPIADDEQGHYAAAPEYYGMLAFSLAASGRLVACSLDPGDRNLKAFATAPDASHAVLTLINKEPSCDATVVLDRESSAAFRSGQIVRLSGPSLESKSGITLGGSPVLSDGVWNSTRVERVDSDSPWKITVPRASAAIVTLNR